MNIVLFNVPVRITDVPRNFPTGLGIVAQILLDCGHQVSVLDINAVRFSDQQTLEWISRQPRPDVVGISGIISTYRYQRWLSRELKEIWPQTTVVCGGGCATSVPELLLREPAIDLLVLGEGEVTFPELLHCLAADGDVHRIAGIAGRAADGTVYKTAPRPVVEHLDELPFPAYHLFPTSIYVNNPLWFNIDETVQRSLNVITSRGCPMDCHFCYHLFGRQSYRQRSAESVVREVSFLKEQYDIQFVGFVDDNTTINRGFLLELCARLKPLNILWGCHGRIDSADEERLAAMAGSGCIWLGFGIESGSQKILDRMHKQVRVSDALAAVRRTLRHGIYPNATFIFGYPGEDLETIRDTMRFQLAMGIARKPFFATPYPGTPLYKYARDAGKIPDEEAFISSLNDASDFRINLTDFSDSALQSLYRQMHQELHRVHSIVDYDGSVGGQRRFFSHCFPLIRDHTLLPESKMIGLKKMADYLESNQKIREADLCREQLRKLQVAMAGTG